MHVFLPTTHQIPPLDFIIFHVLPICQLKIINQTPKLIICSWHKNTGSWHLYIYFPYQFEKLFSDKAQFEWMNEHVLSISILGVFI